MESSNIGRRSSRFWGSKVGTKVQELELKSNYGPRAKRGLKKNVEESTDVQSTTINDTVDTDSSFEDSKEKKKRKKKKIRRKEVTTEEDDEILKFWYVDLN